MEVCLALLDAKWSSEIAGASELLLSAGRQAIARFLSIDALRQLSRVFGLLYFD